MGPNTFRGRLDEVRTGARCERSQVAAYIDESGAGSPQTRRPRLGGADAEAHYCGLVDRQRIRGEVVAWFRDHARPLAWREPGTSPWGVLVSEVMSQQTPVARAEPSWRAWMTRWPTPADLAAVEPAEVLRAWGSLGYPRRALRLASAATALAAQGNEVPDDEARLLELPGVGRYTAAAVMAFAFRRRSVVLDTNIRRVLARLAVGEEFPARSETAAERARAEEWLPNDDDRAAAWSEAVMELGAVVCTARSPQCGDCPVRAHCVWLAAGAPAWQGPERRGQAWVGTDRQCRGRIMGALRRAEAGVALPDIAWPDRAQLERCVASLLDDGLAHAADDRLRLGPA
ncbi:A/G-specific adenine glycosylase [Tessaracoccus sp. OH4464_COT-324]|uniref:A/G-specific adenine glycosylase n=1 Tax=Tessaracoccus sp. OH4464_COT-324 TaxID=2491059 RepID=UPI003516E83F